MEDHSTIPYLREVVIFLIAAGVMVPLFHRFRVSPVLGYLVVGGIIGPAGNFASLPDMAKWILIGLMLLGRLELFAILVLFDPYFWR